jgi:MtN3 and saliva related transmembrane protein
MSLSTIIAKTYWRIRGRELRPDMTSWMEPIGMAAATCTTLCWLPQAVKIVREKRTEGLSLATQSFFTLGIALWAVYGLLLHSWPLILANLATLLLSLTILALKIRYG